MITMVVVVMMWMLLCAEIDVELEKEALDQVRMFVLAYCVCCLW